MNKIIFLCLFFFASVSLWAQKNPVKWEFKSDKAAKGQVKIHLNAILEDKWAIYSQFLESDQGPVATAFTFQLAAGQALVCKAQEVGSKIEGFDNTFEMNLTKYKKQVKFSQIVKAKKGDKIKGYVTYMTCDDNTCLPPRDVEFEILVK
jgi:Disulphide bond corrector protein DsbC